MPPSRPPGPKVIATNRNARRDFDVLETFEAGMVLRGAEVKSLREGHVQFADANVWINDGEAWLLGLHIQPWLAGQGSYAPDPDRRRKLLLHHHEIDELGIRQGADRLALVPLQLYWKDGRVKVEVAVARGRRKADKRSVLAERDANLDIQRALARRQSGKDG
jgi:SsrA-binding protein